MLRAILGTTAGKLFAAVVVIFIIGLVGMVLRDPMHDNVRPIEEVIPTFTPTVVASVASPAATENDGDDSSAAVQGKGEEEATLDAPTSTPQPTTDGWSVETDPVGKEYLSPPPDVEQEIRAAFNAVLSCSISPDGSDEEVMQYDRQLVMERAEQLSTSGVFEQQCAELRDGFEEESLCASIYLYGDEIGPQNPVQCKDRNICTVARAKKGETKSFLLFDVPEHAKCLAIIEDEWGNMCLMRQDGIDNSPNLMYVATVKREKGKWIVTEWYKDKF